MHLTSNVNCNLNENEQKCMWLVYMMVQTQARRCLSFTLTFSSVRVAAAESMPLLLECARVRGPEYLTQMWHFMCDALIKAIGTEPDSDVLSEIMHSFAKVIPLLKLPHRTSGNWTFLLMRQHVVQNISFHPNKKDHVFCWTVILCRKPDDILDLTCAFLSLVH